MKNDIRNLSKWLNEEQTAPIDRQALARVLAMAEQPAPVQGWKMVPVEPTREIEDAIAKARTLKASEIWGDAIAAAPQPAQQQEPKK